LTTTVQHILRGGQNALLCIEGYCKNDKKEGIFTTFLVDSADHSKRYKIWEQHFSNDKLNGQWTTYTLHGTITNLQTFKDDSLNGVTRMFWIDGRSIMEENEFFNGRNKRLHREFYKHGKSWKIVANYTDKGEKRAAGTLNDDTGTIIFYNEDGSVREVISYVNGEEAKGKVQ
jgi:antitoxin component YwqK of YwqJK toxin-antitoxin module